MHLSQAYVNFPFSLFRRLSTLFREQQGKGKVHHRTGQEGPAGELRYSSTLSLSSALDGVGGQRHAPAALPPEKRPGTHFIGGWVGPRAGLDGCGKSHPPTGIRSPDRPARNESLYRLSYPGPVQGTVHAVKRVRVCVLDPSGSGHGLVARWLWQRNLWGSNRVVKFATSWTTIRFQKSLCSTRFITVYFLHSFQLSHLFIRSPSSAQYPWVEEPMKLIIPLPASYSSILNANIPFSSNRGSTVVKVLCYK